MDQELREFLAQIRAENAQMKAEEVKRAQQAARDAQLAAKFEQQKAAFEAKFAQQKAAVETVLARLDSKSATHVTEQPTTAAAAAPQDETPRLCDVQTITVETDNASETDNTLVQADETDDASETNDNALVQANEASEFNTITLIQADIASENRNEHASRTGKAVEEIMLEHVKESSSSIIQENRIHQDVKNTDKSATLICD